MNREFMTDWRCPPTPPSPRTDPTYYKGEVEKKEEDAQELIVRYAQSIMITIIINSAVVAQVRQFRRRG